MAAAGAGVAGFFEEGAAFFGMGDVSVRVGSGYVCRAQAGRCSFELCGGAGKGQRSRGPVQSGNTKLLMPMGDLLAFDRGVNEEVIDVPHG